MGAPVCELGHAQDAASHDDQLQRQRDLKWTVAESCRVLRLIQSNTKVKKEVAKIDGYLFLSLFFFFFDRLLALSLLFSYV